MKKAITVRLDESVVSELQQYFISFNAAAELILEPISKLISINHARMVEIFSPEELTMIIESQKGLLLQPETLHNKEFMVTRLRDYCLARMNYDRSNFNEADFRPLFENVKSISDAEAFLFLLWIHRERD